MGVKELEAEVARHNRLYFVENTPEISDYEFDQLIEELRRRKPDSKVLREITSDARQEAKKIRHVVPMLSLDKCYDEKSLMDWADKVSGDFIASPKIDGLAVSLKYGGDGGLAVAATRGDGVTGEDITKNALNVKSIPSRIPAKGIEVRGEVYMPLSVFKRYSSEFSNPRNLAAGAVKQKDQRKAAEYALSFFAYDMLGDKFKTQEEKFRELEGYGFSVVEWRRVERGEMQKEFERCLKARDAYDFEVDGVVFRANDVSEQERLAVTTHHPRYAIAYKFQGDSGTTVLSDIEWSVSRTGLITPVAIVDPVELSGAMVSRASLHNVGIMRELGLTKGARVMMMRRGGVIPNLEAVVEKGEGAIAIPKSCPSCGAKIREEEGFLYCTNPKSCVRSKVGELEHFVKTIGIDGFGEKLIQRLYEEGLVTDPSEFFELTKDELMRLDRMGDVLAEKLLANIRARSAVALSLFLQSLGIRELGRHAASILEQFETIKKVMSLKEEDLSSIKTIGDVIAHEVVEGLARKRPLIERLLRHMKIEAPRKKRSQWPHAGKSFLFTGSLVSMERGKAQGLVEEMGGIVAQSVTKDLDFLVVGDGGGAGSKLDKAKRLQGGGGRVKIISEKEFLSYVER
jgi:DNA ligase (NAD+)